MPRKEANHLKWGIVGTGYMASVWADLLLNSRIGVLDAVCSRDTARADVFARRFGARQSYGDVNEMLVMQMGKLDCIYVATPLENHATTIAKCLRAGFNVLTEKPATERAEEWAGLMALAKGQGSFLAEGMWTRCLPTFRQAEEWMGHGRIGAIRWIRADLQKFVAPGPGGKRSGVLMDYGVYPLYLACHFLGGAPQRIDFRKRLSSGEFDADWGIIAERNGVTALLNISSSFAGGNRAAIIGEHGAIEWGDPFNRTNQILLHDFRDGSVIQKTYPYHGDGFEHQLADVTRSIQRGLVESSLLTHQMTLETLYFAERLQSQNT
ncbi:Gfo/Idh/MocA family oxidoreductase [Erythrobacter sp.]|uniref:Gfo/Idh/MocA family protein n=1 Tax=Erythrobacter sp. TaxID=1042 RepID=UPI0025C0B73A|nr:Gfo/Idh/MocA family oxidoreductase [Erythrobacter sp.]